MELKQKIPQLHKTTNPKHREDYVFVEKPGEDFTALKLISGPFSSIVYKYGAVGFRPESEKRPDGSLPMQFDYVIIENNIEAERQISGRARVIYSTVQSRRPETQKDQPRGWH